MSIDPKKFPILIVDDEQDNVDAFRFNFKRTFSIISANSGPEALDLLRENEVSVIVTDQRMPKMTGLEMLGEAATVQPDATGIILTAFTDVDVLIESINLGRIYRYITKPWDANEVRGVLTHAIERFHLKRENTRLQNQLEQYTGYLNQEIHGAFDFGNIIGASGTLREVLEKVEQVAATTSTVLLRGETGTGKELVAHAIHINSPRENKPFGGHETIKVDVRVISATNRDLETMIEQGEFREDLYYRLNVFPINLPPLRDRLDDLPVLVDHFVAKFGRRKIEGGCTPAALQKLASYTWPGNVRELENIIERASILARDEKIDARHLDFGRRAQTQSGSVQVLPPEPASWSGAADAAGDDDASKPLAERLLDSEKREIISAVDRCNSNIAGAARMLGINRSTLYYRMRKHGLEHLLPTKVTTGPGERAAPAQPDKPEP